LAITLTFPDGAALITGGTGRVGGGAVRRFAEAGVPVVFTYKSRKDAALELERTLQGEGYVVYAMQMDAAITQSIEDALDFATKKFGRIHSVVCGSGTEFAFSRLADYPEEYVNKYINDDAMGYYRIFRAVIPRLRTSGGGSVSACTTVATHRHLSYDGLSAFSKGAVYQLVQNSAAEEGKHNIRFNSVQIGCVTWETLEQMRAMVPAENPADPETSEECWTVLMNDLLGRMRLGRVVNPLEAGGVCCFLASDQGAFLTGQQLALDSGALL